MEFENLSKYDALGCTDNFRPQAPIAIFLQVTGVLACLCLQNLMTFIIFWDDISMYEEDSHGIWPESHFDQMTLSIGVCRY